MTKKKALSLLAMPSLLILSYGLDDAIAALKAFRASTFIFTTAWIDVLLEFVFAGAVIFLIWLALVWCEKDLLVGWAFVVTGLIAFVVFTPYTHYLIARNIRDFLGLRPPIFIGFLSKASALTTMLGAAHILRKPR
ncbi:MAG: hypothetical protein WC832_06115 [Anaerolineales bacterium]